MRCRSFLFYSLKKEIGVQTKKALRSFSCTRVVVKGRGLQRKIKFPIADWILSKLFKAAFVTFAH